MLLMLIITILLSVYDAVYALDKRAASLGRLDFTNILAESQL